MTGEPPPKGVYLSSRDKQVLELVAEGLTDIEIGQHIHLSPKSVNWRIETLKQRFKVKTRIQVVVIALRRKLID
jgi:DNA-binding NarL/FixJ family response regulator